MRQCGICGNVYEEQVAQCPIDGTRLSLASALIANTTRMSDRPIFNSGLINTDNNSQQLAPTGPPFGQAFFPSFGESTESIDNKTDPDQSLDGPTMALVFPPPNIDELAGRILNNTYRLEKRLGQGGMGTVYKATHLKIGDTVAIKFITPELSSNPTLAARFQREALAARKLSHPDAVIIYELSETLDGLLFIVMQYVEGERLDVYLKRTERLSAPRVLHILRCIVDVLDTAHRIGIVHRDIKPANLMLYNNSRGEERIKVLDFGIAKLIDSEETFDQWARITQKGDIFGSPFYMSPEHAMGGEVDARSDLYSIGVIVYQMVTGELPFTGKTGREVIDAHLYREPTPPSLVYATKINYDAVILKAIAKKPEDRYQSMTDFLASFAALLNSATVTVMRAKSQESPLPEALKSSKMPATKPMPQVSKLPDKPARPTEPFFNPLLNTSDELNRVSLAILPLKRLSDDQEIEMLSVGLADTLISELAVVQNLILRPLRAVLKYEYIDWETLDIGQQLGVDFALGATIQAFGPRVRLCFRMVDIKRKQDVWRDRFEVLSEAPLIIQDTLTQCIVENMGINIREEEKALLAQVPSQARISAQPYHMRGRYLFERAMEMQDIELALAMFLQAIDIDRSFARAYLCVAQCHYQLHNNYSEDINHISVAEESCRKAIELDANMAEAYSTLATIYLDLGRRLEAFDLINKALMLSPYDLEANLALGRYHRDKEQFERAFSAYNRAMRSDPSYWRTYWAIVFAYLYRGNFDQAEAVAATYLNNIDSEQPAMIFLKGLIAVYKGQLEEAEAYALKLPAMATDLRALLFAQLHAVRQQAVHAENQLANVRYFLGPKEDLYYLQAQVLSRCGQVASAIENLERAIALGNKNFSWFQRDPALERMRTAPIFSQLLKDRGTFRYRADRDKK
ncbi:MAG: protein kinase [Acidobacteriota bacterium]